MLRTLIGKILFPASLLAAFFFTDTTAIAQEVLAVKFPQGEQKDRTSPVTRRFTVQGPGLVTIKIKLIPYKSLGFSPNVPVGFRAAGSNNRFTEPPLPGGIGGKAVQLGQEVQNYKDNVPIEFSTIYKLTDDKVYAVEVQASPQTWMLNQGTYWQEGQEVRVAVESESAKISTLSTSRPAPVVKQFPTIDVLTSKVWQFGRSDGTLLVSRMRLMPGGRIEGAAHPNESRWAMAGNELLFYDAQGHVSTRYNSFKQVGGRWVISGPFLLWGNITHVLKEVE